MNKLLNIFLALVIQVSLLLCLKDRFLTVRQYFNESLSGIEDIEWYLRISSFVKFGSIPKVLMKLRQTKNSLSRVQNVNNEKVFISCVNNYYLQKKGEDKSKVSKSLWGIATLLLW